MSQDQAGEDKREKKCFCLIHTVEQQRPDVLERILRRMLALKHGRDGADAAVMCVTLRHWDFVQQMIGAEEGESETENSSAFSIR